MPTCQNFSLLKRDFPATFLGVYKLRVTKGGRAVYFRASEALTKNARLLARRLGTAGIVIGLSDLALDYGRAEETGNWKEFYESTGGFGGAFIGGYVGASGGTALLPGFGTVTVGVIGSLAGERAGKAFGGWLYKSINGR